jgi:hypothetical protein
MVRERPHDRQGLGERRSQERVLFRIEMHDGGRYRSMR